MKRYQASISRVAMWGILVTLVTVQVHAQGTQGFTAQQAVDYAMKNSATIKNALRDIQIQQQSNREVTSAAWPQVNGTINVTDFLDIPTTLIPAEIFGGPAGTFQPVQFGTKYTGSYGFSAEQILFDGQVFVGLQARKASIDYATANAGITAEQIKVNVYKIYYQLVIGKKLIGTLDANIARSEKLLHDTKALYENGFQEKLDVDKVNVTLSNLRTQKLKTENQLNVGYTALKYLMGMPIKEELILTDTLAESNLKEGVLYDSINYNDRKEYQALKTLEQLNQFNIKRYKMSYIPTAKLTGNYSRNAQRNKFDFFKGGQPWFTTSYIGLQINVPIFDGFGKDARVKKARLELLKTQTSISDLENKITAEADTSLVGLRNALVTLEEQRKNMMLAEQVYNQTKKKYEQGLGSNTEISNADAELKTAQNNYYAALVDAVIARIDYLKAVGKL